MIYGRACEESTRQRDASNADIRKQQERLRPFKKRNNQLLLYKKDTPRKEKTQLTTRMFALPDGKIVRPEDKLKHAVECDKCQRDTEGGGRLQL